MGDVLKECHNDFIPKLVLKVHIFLKFSRSLHAL